MRHTLALIVLLVSGSLVGCGDDEGTEADRIGVGAECTVTADCPLVEFEAADGGVQQLECLTGFSGGYCGLRNCASTLECPLGSICVAHDDGNSYCFRSCLDKSECNINRTPDNESNCSASFDWQVPAEDDNTKACIPPSSGI